MTGLHHIRPQFLPWQRPFSITVGTSRWREACLLDGSMVVISDEKWPEFSRQLNC